MRTFGVITPVIMALLIMTSVNIHAAGYFDPNKEDCKCDTLVKQGIKPDVLNRVHQAWVFLNIGPILDSVATGLKGVLSQFGLKSSKASRYETAGEVGMRSSKKNKKVRKVKAPRKI